MSFTKNLLKLTTYYKLNLISREMKNSLLSLMALCTATMSSLPILAATEWDNPTIETTVINLETGGTYFVYHPATQMFMVNGNASNTQLSLGKTGLKINIKPATDERFAVSGWTLEMPDATANNGGKPKYIWLTGDGISAYVDFNLQTDGHYIWKITKNPDSDTYRIKMPDEDPVFGLEAQEGMYANAYMGWDGLLNEDGTMNNTIVMPTVNKTTAGYENAEIDWAFVTEDHYAAYEAKFSLKEALEYAVEHNYMDYSDYEALYNSNTASAENILSAAKELIKKVDDSLIANADAEHPVDLTHLISEPSFEDGTGDWVTERDPQTGRDNFGIQPASQPTTDGAAFASFFERWVANSPQSNWSILQTVNDLPQGKYKLSAYAIINHDTPAGAYLVANGGLGEERAPMNEPGNVDGVTTARPYSIDFMVTGNSAEIGLRVINANFQWIGIDNFKLMYYGKSDSFAREELQNAIEEAETYMAQLTEESVKYSAKNQATLEAELQLAKDGLANSELKDDSIISLRMILNQQVETVKRDVQAYEKLIPLIDDKLAQLIDNYPPYIELSNNPEAFVNIYNYTDALEAAYNDRTFDPNEIDSVSIKIDEEFRKDVFEMIQNGLTNDLYGMIQSPDFTDGAAGWNGGPFASSHVAEIFNKQFDVYQELEGLPEGAYKITAKGYYRPGNNNVIDENWNDGTTNNVYAYLYGNENTTLLHHICDELSDIPYISKDDGSTNDYSFASLEGKYIPNDLSSAEVAFGQGKYLNEVTCVVMDGKLRFGIKMQSDQSLSGNWTAFDEFRIVYLGNSVEYYLPTIQTLSAQASDLNDQIMNYEAYATQDAISMLNSTISDAEAITTTSTVDEAKSVINRLTESISYTNKSIEVIKSLSALINDINEKRGEELQNAGYDLSNVFSVTDEVSVLMENNEIESIEKAEEYITEINTLLTQSIQSGQIAGASKDNPVELKDIIVNPGFSIYDNETGVTTDSGDGWTREFNGGSSSFYVSCCEFYNNYSFNIYQKICGLAAGFYKVSCNAFYRDGGAMESAANYRDQKEQLNAMLYAGPEDSWTYTPIMSIIEGGQAEASASQNINVADSLTTNENPIEFWYIPNAMQDASPAFNQGLYYNELYFEVKEGQTYANIGIRKDQHISGDWTIFDNFKLYYCGNGEENRPDGIQNTVKETSSIVRSTYFAIDGTRIAQPTKRGIYIRKDEMSDGSVKTYKFILNK